MFAIGQCCPDLSVLSVADCRSIGEKSLLPLHERGVKLDVQASYRYYIRHDNVGRINLDYLRIS